MNTVLTERYANNQLLHLLFPSMNLSKQRIVFSLFFLCAILFLEACSQQSDLPDSTSEAYREAVSSFYIGLAAMQVGEDLRADAALLQTTNVAPGEPAAWANLALLALRRGDIDRATERLRQARTLAPGNSEILLLAGLLALYQDDLDVAKEHLHQAIAADDTNYRARYALANLTEQEGNLDEAADQIAHLRAQAPDNLAALHAEARLAARRGEAATLAQATMRLDSLSADWPTDIREALVTVQATAEPQQAVGPLAVLRNVLLSLPAYRRDLAAIEVPAEQVADPIEQFLRLPSPRATPALPDEDLTFAAQALTTTDTSAWDWLGVISLTGDGAPSVFVADGQRVQMLDGEAVPFPGGAAAQPPTQQSIVPLDFNYDFRMDLALVGAGGLRLFQQDSTTVGAFMDVTARTTLSTALTDAAYVGGWAADLDLEGDMDLLLATPQGPPRILRNNGDGTFRTEPLFQEVTALRDFAWADFDADGDPDAALLDASGTLHVFANDRQNRVRRLDLGANDRILALAAADIDNNSIIDLVLLRADGILQHLTYEPAEAAWTRHDIARWANLATDAAPGTVRLFTGDLDNNGGFDLLASDASGTAAWLHDETGAYHALIAPLDLQLFALAALADETHLDLLGLTADGQPIHLVNRSTLQYVGRQIRPRAATALGDQRINSFGIGGEVEVRSGLLFQKQSITQPILHFGMGNTPLADVARIIWPNGDVQAEFDLLDDEVLRAQQRLKGSCPWLFTYDGTGMRFVTDFLWRSPLGLRINAQETAGIMTTEDWVLIESDELVPRDGYYDVRITAELWETHFFDHVSLMVVDHPVETAIHVDERFAFPPPPLEVFAATPSHPIRQAWDETGQDVTALIRDRDAQYLSTFAPGRYQGIAEPHSVEIDLGDEVPSDGPLRLLGFGWIRPTDSSINVAISQGDVAAPQGLRLEVADGQGGWRVVDPNLGFPSGKHKTILIDLEGAFQPDAPRRVRLSTNLEIYWDAFTWTTLLPDADLRTQRLAPERADLRYRGYSDVNEANRASPEVPDYETLVGTAPRWLDLVGYYTRYGDVRPLLDSIDDRYVIMNAGDEMRFRFPVPPPPPDGWQRDFVLIGDGWVKDGDYNTTYSTTVRPLPRHDTPAYDTPPGRLQDDPVYRRYPQDWQTYHTRYVTPGSFQQALRPALGER